MHFAIMYNCCLLWCVVLTLTHTYSYYYLYLPHIQSAALCDACLSTVQAGDVIQLERKGFFRCDVAYGGSADKPAVLFMIPDGKPKKATAVKK